MALPVPSSSFAYSALPPGILRAVVLVGLGLVALSVFLGAIGPRRSGGATGMPAGGSMDAGSPPPHTATTRNKAAAARPAARPPRTSPVLGGWLPLLVADAVALACLHLGIGSAIIRLLAAWGLAAEAMTLAAFVPWAARHRAWHLADYGHFLTLLPGLVAAILQGQRTDSILASFSSVAARRRADLAMRAETELAAWRVDQALRRHSSGYAASGARIEAEMPAGDGALELLLCFPGGIPDAAAEAAFREHATSGILARAAGVAADRASLVERPDGALALRVQHTAPISAATGGDPSLVPVPAGEAPAPASEAPAQSSPTTDDTSPLGPGLPPLDLLAVPPAPPDQEDGADVARRVLEALHAQGIGDARAAAVRIGPTVTTVIVRPPGGPGAARILRLGEDLRFRLGLGGIMVRRAEGWPGCAAIEVPNARRARVSLRAVLARLRDGSGEMLAPLGVSTDGTPLLTDLADWPHGLVAGTTGGGKSVFVNSVLVSLLLRYRPDQLRLLLLDPKRVELSMYRGLPHLARPIVAGVEGAVAALQDAVAEMRRRYAALERAGARKLSEYNARVPAADRLPRLLIVIDEAQALMVDKDSADEVVAASKDLAAMGRAAGVHLLYCTQYPLATIIPSALKANTPTRVALLVPSRVNSQVILDQEGAEELLGAGDMLVCLGGAAEVRRVQSAFVSEDEVRAVVAWWARRGKDDGGEGADGTTPSAASRQGDPLHLLRALATEVMAQEAGLCSAHVAFVRRGEYIAVRRDHAERVLRRMGAEPAPTMAAWRETGVVRTAGDQLTPPVRAPWGARTRMLVLEWDAVRPEDGPATGDR